MDERPEDDREQEYDDWREHELDQHCRRAVELADRLGIYAVPCRHASGRVYWNPRQANGNDPDLGWLIDSQPTASGWLSWADAVVAIGHRLTPPAPAQREAGED